MSMYVDGDGDGATVGGPTTVCTDGATAPAGYLFSPSATDDCADDDNTRSPFETEVCDGIDNDCDGFADSTETCLCDVGYRDGDTLKPYNFCYRVVPTTDPLELTWTNAFNDCANYPTYRLIMLEDAAEAAWLRTQITGKWWIGLNDINVEGTWVWSDNSPLTYSAWKSGEPNNSGGEDCAETDDVGWNDEGCGEVRAYVCESYPQ